MKRIVIYLFTLCLLSSLSGIDISGVQSGTWIPANNPHLLIADVNVPAGAELTILPGVIVQAMGNYRINAQGTIQAIGSPADSIYFLNAQAPPSTMWKGLRLENAIQPSNFAYCVVEYAEYGINAVDSPIEVSYSRFSRNQRGLHLFGIGNLNPAVMNVHHNLVEYSVNNGIFIPQNSNAWVHHNELRFNGTSAQYYGAIQLSNQSPGGQNSPIIEHNYVHHNFKQGITAWDIVGASAINVIIRFNHIEANLTGIYLLNASGIVHNNTIINNFIAGDTNSGAGIMIGGATSHPYIAENIITGNFTALYITQNALPVLGNLAENHPWAYGQNVIRDNIDESNTLYSVVCASYSASTNVIKAENNDWGVYTPAEISIGIVDQNDNASLPTVDFEPWFEPPTGVTINGSYTWDTEDYSDLAPQELQLLLVDTVTREIVETHVLSSNPFSFSSDVSGAFFALLTAVDSSRELWAGAGGLENSIIFDPAIGAIDLGNIYIDAWQHFELEVRGETEIIEGREVWPLYHSFLLFAVQSIDYFYDEGDFRYIYKHEYRGEEGWHEINFAWGTQYARIANISHTDQWNQTCVEEGQIVQNMIMCLIDDNNRKLIITSSIDGVFLKSQRFTDTESELIYLYDELGFAERYLNVLQTAEHRWMKYHQPNLNHPHELSSRIAASSPEQVFAMHFWWQAPAYSGVDYNAYRIYKQQSGAEPELFATVTFAYGPVHYNESVTGSGRVDFWVVATDGENESEASNIVQFDFPIANEDLVLKPSLNVYPNPLKISSDNALTIQSKGFIKPHLQIYNIRGQQVFSGSIEGERYQWPGLDLKGKAVASGIYLLRIESNNQAPLSRKIMVVK